MSQRIIGIGSPFGADRAAWWVIDELRGRLPTDIELITLDRPGATLITWLSADSDVTLIDAALGCPAGKPFVRVLPGQLVRREQRLDSHGEQLADTLALAGVLGRLPRRLAIYAIDIVANGQMKGRTTPPRGVRLLRDFLVNKLNECGPQPHVEPRTSRR